MQRSGGCYLLFHHDLEESDDDLGARSDQNLTLSFSFSVDNVVKGIVQYTHAHHFCGIL